jgi:hypothetical protein
VHPVVDDADAQEQRADTSPWLSITIIAPSMPCRFIANRPKVTNAMWATEE